MKNKLVFFMASFLLTGCAIVQPKVVEVPIAIPCSKPVMPVYHDYMADLRNDATAKEFVPACLMTRESCNNFVKSFNIYQEK